VFSLPKRIRALLPHDPRLAGDVQRVLLRGIRTALRRASPPATGAAQIGAASFLYRWHGNAERGHVLRGVTTPARLGEHIHYPSP
jgi:hypothetical protein